MTSSLLNLLGLRGTSNSNIDENSPVRALPASWYTSQDMFELERRAIFSRKWLLTTHRARFPNVGDWVRYDVAGYQFVIVKDREGKINAFHNVCRHRGFPVVTEEKGSAKIFACKYHGWSYGLNGNLAKAPGYQELGSFDKSKNGLFQIHVHVDNNGFIWVNLDAGAKPEVAWEDDFKGIDLQPRFKNYNFEEYIFDHTWEMEGDYNWKILADNYNECYHCPTTHPDIPEVADLSSYSVCTKDGGIIHDAHSTPEQIERGLRIACTYYFPNASMNISPHFFFMQRFVPKSPTRAVMKYEVYRNKNSSDADFELVNAMYKRIMSEDKYLCNLTQQNLNAGVFINGELHPRMEKGPLYFQKVVRDSVLEHYKREQEAKHEIWPARQVLPKNASVSEKDVDFCSNLSCQAGDNCCSNNITGQSVEGTVW
ncbi:rieske [2Fe-2S] domain protein [Xylogone sp. PMI_703]|nr:rieske [2Fe-2S] domain protein [Xylogone sp. PMI_703]